MTIYLEKNKQGEPTGVWIVEIRKMAGGVSKTIRQRTRDYSEAKRIEASLRGSLGDQGHSRQTRLPVRVQPKISSVGSGSYDSQGIEGFSLSDMTPPPQIFTLRDLYDGARSIYRGIKDQKQSEERLNAALEIIGWDRDIQE